MKNFLTILLLLPSLASAADFGVNATDYDGGAWSPYLVGAGIGVLSWLTFYFADKPIGASSFYAMVAGLIGKSVARKHTESLKYYQTNPPAVDYGFVFVTCTILGGFISAWTGDEIRNEWLHPMWVDRFGDSIALRGIVGFIGGVLMAFGSRLAGGCTSGHGISGTFQLNAGSWLTVIFMFVGGIATAMLLYTTL
ncbi:YeeE/YedE thiosulfate transporter family protein [Prosthecobacter sp.]|uniref:YeeE/YedE thiosulfate transporter family protein n=1 Tax=Prosthecobacter sp. TaxID=1965333 RepID=UPI002ABCF76E|nr:YeeE/YedE thiosulfate transporter family protein [Prosthecobacter sp.]MDZ4401724.1 YeeE/YedE thiosulfate transporter family protein [Prosthecobacter sp.]